MTSASLNIDLLKRICESPGIGGREDVIRDLVKGELAAVVDDVSVDALGNVIGVKRGQGGPRVMVAAHIDEIGFFVKHIDDKGFIRLQPVGGFDPRVLIAQRVRVHGFGGESLPGVIGLSAKPIHLLDPSDIKPPKLDELFVDIGLNGDDARQRVEVGDMVTLDRTVERVGDNVIGKSMDDRVCVFQMIEALRLLDGATNAEIVAVATTQEEVGLRGAQTAAQHIGPDIAVALDVTLAMDIPGSAEQDAVTRLGDGVAIKIMDSSMISNHRFVRHMRDLAHEHGIAHQIEILPRGGTDAGAMQRVHAGVPAITLSIPTRYVHTVNEMCAVSDIQAAINLLARFLERAHEGDYSFG
ncbi:MAG TPA: M42 family metallopeptidase [Thermomicrobiales bacterium]|nr:M42 family metallopeptidase [Thermomicrobiales bacterium]